MINLTKKAVFKQLMVNRRNLYHLFSRFFQREVDQPFYDSLKAIVFPTDREENALTEFKDALLR